MPCVGGRPLAPFWGYRDRRRFFLHGESQHALGDEPWFQVLLQTPDGLVSPAHPSAVPLGAAVWKRLEAPVFLNGLRGCPRRSSRPRAPGLPAPAPAASHGHSCWRGRGGWV